MSYTHERPPSQDEPVAVPIIVMRWLTVALPQDLAEALDRHAASLGPEVTAAEVTRRLLRSALLGREPTLPLAM